MAIGPQNQRDQLMVAIAVLAIAGAGAYWYFVYDPKTADVAKVAMHVDSLDIANQKAKAQMAKGTITTIKAEADAYRQNLDVMRTLVPAQNEVPSLLEQVSTATRRVKLDIGSVEPEPLIEGEMFDTYRYKLKVTGTFDQIGNVLTNIASLNRVVAPINLQLDLPTAAVKAAPGTQPLAATFEIQTYVVRTAPPAKKKAPAGGKPKPPAAEGP
ncbi:MAG: type 4a pilus biogenesis protein PilO [Gemmatimonadetes bacterium]|nr:type 4a pilus biogenesis protein PilO [Gemmatimonadota bacterium]MBI3567632.1 type 4a pilus biogenesis protein PilO [Gemmatimonadota bacterium]